MSRAREYIIKAYRSKGTKLFVSKTISLDDELMSTGIVSSKEGHDESHIDDTKIRT